MSTFADELKELALTAPKEKDSEDVFNEGLKEENTAFPDTLNYEDGVLRTGYLSFMV